MIESRVLIFLIEQKITLFWTLLLHFVTNAPGTDSIKLNSIIQSKMSTKKLELGKEKCFQIHVGNNNANCCPELNVHDVAMKTASSEKYLGDIITNDGKIDEN